MKVFGLAGWSGSGKTTLMVRLLPELTRRGVTVSTVKHAHHKFDVDKPGKDSYRHREAGATEVMVSSENRWALMHEHRGAGPVASRDPAARPAHRFSRGWSDAECHPPEIGLVLAEREPERSLGDSSLPRRQLESLHLQLEAELLRIACHDASLTATRPAALQGLR